MNGTANGTTWMGQPVPCWARPILDSQREHIMNVIEIKAAARADVIDDQRRKNLERERSMLLCHVDEIEQSLGYGQGGEQPRTSQIRSFWKRSGRPPLNS